MLVLHGADDRALVVKKKRAQSEARIKLRRFHCFPPPFLSSVEYKDLGSWRKRTGYRFYLPPFRRKLCSPLNRHGFFSSTKWQPCCRQPGSPAALCERGGTGGASSSLFPQRTPACSPCSCCFGWRSCLAPAKDDQSCGLKSKRGCHRNAQLSP